MRKLTVIWLFIAFFFIIVTTGVYVTFLSKPRSFSLDSSNLAPQLNIPTAKTETEEVITLLFAGDVMLDRNIRLKAQQNGYDFLIGTQLRELLHSADHVILNLEGPITDNQSVSVGSAVGSTNNFLFTFSPESIDFLSSHNIDIVNLGNNHILNFGTAGLAQTYDYLDQSKISYFGFTGSDQPADKFTYILDHHSYNIGFVNYNQFISGGEEQVFLDIAALRSQVDFLIVYTHWGNEYVPENAVLKNLAYRLIDSGADMIIGSHPHVITGHEVYKEKHIYYSLGNFIFDQYFEPAVKQGLVVMVDINSKTGAVDIREHQVFMDGSGQTELANP